MEAVIFIGAQASGKSTFFHERFRDSHVRVNLDMLKTRHRESLLLHACIEMKQPFVVDNTNPTPEERERYIKPAKAAAFRISGYYFESRIQTLIQRNSLRLEHERVPEAGIRGTYNQLVLPEFAEGFDSLYYVSISSHGSFLIAEWSDEI